MRRVRVLFKKITSDKNVASGRCFEFVSERREEKVRGEPSSIPTYYIHYREAIRHVVPSDR